MSDKTSSKNWFARHKVLSVVGALVVLGIIGAAAGGGNTKNTNNNSTTATTATQTSSKKAQANTASITPTLNQPASDGKFQFTVTAFQCGITQITQSDNQYDVATPQGQYCTMSLNVKNIGTVSQSFDDSSQYIYDSSNKQYNDDSNGTIAANPSSSQFMDLPNVNPGVSISGVLAFDIPKGITPTYAILHDSSLSNGVRINLQ